MPSQEAKESRSQERASRKPQSATDTAAGTTDAAAPSPEAWSYIGTNMAPGTSAKIFFVKEPRRRPMRELGRFIMASQARINEWATRYGLSGLAWRVFLFIASCIDYDDGVVLSYSEIAAALDADPREVRRAVAKLAAADILTTEPSRRGCRTSPRRYFLNPFGVARGQAERVSDQQRQWQERRRAIGAAAPKVRGTGPEAMLDLSGWLERA